MFRSFILKENFKKSLIKKNKNTFFLDKFHFSSQGSNSFFKSANIIGKERYKKSERLHAYKKCEKIYNSILKDLINELNKMHKISEKKKYWEIIIAHWLQRFIHINYYNYNLLKKGFKSKEKVNVFTFYSKTKNLHTQNSYDLKVVCNNYQWNFTLLAEMIKFFNYNANFIYQGNTSSRILVKESSRKINFIYKIIDSLLQMFSRNNTVIFVNSGLPFFFEKKLEINLNQIPRLLKFDESILNLNNYDENLRKSFNLKFKKNGNLEDFIRYLIPYSLPISFVESFKSILDKTKYNFFPSKPKFIITAYDYDSNDFFKIYTANKIKFKSKYVIIQHGNNYFTSVDAKYFPEIRICDKFLSWGPREKNKHFPLFNTSVLNKKKIINQNTNRLTIITTPAGSRLKIWDRFSEACTSAGSTVDIISKLDKNISENVNLKLFSSKSNFLNLDNFIKKKYFEKLKVNKIQDEKSFFQLCEKTKLFLFMYDSTGLLQNLNLNIPSVAYWENTYDNLNRNYIKYYELLFEAKILFKNKSSLVKHINQNWNKIESWWFSKNTQSKIIKFNNKLNNTMDKTKIKKLTKLLISK